MEQRTHGFDVWQDPMVTLRVPKLFDLRADPFERGDKEGMGYDRWRIDRVFLLVPAQVFVTPLHPDPGRVPAAPEAGLVQPGGRARQADAAAGGRELASRSQCLQQEEDVHHVQQKIVDCHRSCQFGTRRRQRIRAGPGDRRHTDDDPLLDRRAHRGRRYQCPYLDHHLCRRHPPHAEREPDGRQYHQYEGRRQRRGSR